MFNYLKEFFTLIRDNQSFILILTIMFICLLSYSYARRPLNFIHEKSDGREINSLARKGFPNGWIAICGSDELKAASIKKVQFCGNNIILLRSSANGKPYALDAYCPHLGADLSVGGKIVKNCESDCVRCPFHGWVFRASDGAAIEVPYTKDMKAPVGVKIKTWNCLELNDFIFIWYHAQDKQPTWFPPRIEQIDTKEWELIGRAEYIIKCPVQDIAENLADTAHANIIHSPLYMIYKTLTPSKLPVLNLFSLNHDFSWNKCDPPDEHKATANISSKLLLLNRFVITSMSIDPVEQHGPCVIYFHKKIKFGPFDTKGIMVITNTPIGDRYNVTRTVHRLYLESKWISRTFGKLLFMIEIDNTLRDIVIWNNKMYIKSPPYVEQEKQMSRFRRWFAQFYTNQNELSHGKDLSW